MRRLIGMVFTQMSAKAGIQKHGERAIVAMIKELYRLVDGAIKGRPVVQAVEYISLSLKDKKEDP